MSLVAALLLLAQAAAPHTAGPLVLWNNLTLGMSKAEFKGLYPVRRVDLGQGCFGDLGAEFAKQGLQRVHLEWSLKDGQDRCAEVVLKSLQAKYGPPSGTSSEVQLTDCGYDTGGVAGALSNLCRLAGGDQPKQYIYARWISQGVEIALKLDQTSTSQWWLDYQPAVTASKEAQSKL
jgi:hypothetical protein